MRLHDEGARRSPEERTASSYICVLITLEHNNDQLDLIQPEADWFVNTTQSF